ncbi:MAG: hypothetical protein V3U98_09245 [Acidobacteriota bacterium]
MTVIMTSSKQHRGGMSDIIYDLQGRPVYRVLRRGRIVDFTGRSVAWIDSQRNIYDYHGIHRGWYEDGAWVDHDGGLFGFAPEVSGPTPELPRRLEESPRARKPSREPPRPDVYFPPARPQRCPRWSRRPLGASRPARPQH